MPHSEARIHTADPNRYLVQLCRHAEKIGHAFGRGHLRLGGARPARDGADHSGRERPEVLGAEWTESTGTLRLTWGTCTLRAEGETLTVRAEAAGDDDLKRLQDLIAANLERFGRRDGLRVTWTPAGDPGR